MSYTHVGVLGKIKSIVYHTTQEFHQPINIAEPTCYIGFYRPIVIGQARWSSKLASRRSWVRIPLKSPCIFFHRHSESTEYTARDTRRCRAKLNQLFITSRKNFINLSSFMFGGLLAIGRVPHPVFSHHCPLTQVRQNEYNNRFFNCSVLRDAHINIYNRGEIGHLEHLFSAITCTTTCLVLQCAL